MVDITLDQQIIFGEDCLSITMVRLNQLVSHDHMS